MAYSICRLPRNCPATCVVIVMLTVSVRAAERFQKWELTLSHPFLFPLPLKTVIAIPAIRFPSVCLVVFCVLDRVFYFATALFVGWWQAICPSLTPKWLRPHPQLKCTQAKSNLFQTTTKVTTVNEQKIIVVPSKRNLEVTCAVNHFSSPDAIIVNLLSPLWIAYDHGLVNI